VVLEGRRERGVERAVAVEIGTEREQDQHAA